MSILVLYVATALIFVALDALMLTLVMKPLFQAHIGPLLRETPRMGAAAAFYLGYVAGLVWLVAWPALRADAALTALVGGAVLGAIAYGTYELTSYAIMREWHLAMVVIDIGWGAFLTGVSASAGVLIARAVATF